MGYSRLLASSAKILVKLVIYLKFVKQIFVEQLVAMLMGHFVPFILCQLELCTTRIV